MLSHVVPARFAGDKRFKLDLDPVDGSQVALSYPSLGLVMPCHGPGGSHDADLVMCELVRAVDIWKSLGLRAGKKGMTESHFLLSREVVSMTDSVL